MDNKTSTHIFYFSNVRQLWTVTQTLKGRSRERYFWLFL